MTRFVINVDDERWKASHLPRILRTSGEEWLGELASQIDGQLHGCSLGIVLDLTDSDASYLASYLHDFVENHPNILGTIGRDVFIAAAEQIEAQSKPARIERPGLYGLVEASCVHLDARGPWVRDALGWVRIGLSDIRAHNHDGWDDLIDPTLVRGGIES